LIDTESEKSEEFEASVDMDSNGEEAREMFGEDDPSKISKEPVNFLGDGIANAC